MLRIDSHQHFWKYNALRDSWITDDMSMLRNDFLPQQLEPILREFNFDGCIAVQSDQSPEENAFQLENAGKHAFIKAVVGWVDLQAVNITEQLEELHQYEKLKGFRHILQSEADRSLMLKPAFMNGVSQLNQYGFTYDILILRDQLTYAAELTAKFPNQPFVLDHMAKPDVKNKSISQWKTEIRELAKRENTCCKISGMLTEADWKSWKPEDLIPYLDVVFEAFGSKRIMYGSDWPVSLLAAKYAQQLNMLQAYVTRLSKNEQQLFWGGNAAEFYNLK
ncbi:amidohydrolase family protein [Pedobacter metabolipauper]|uniref:L-fuconolactonase n=1 Tax=Pedobacter metabolipauper TaxID=425513 RepID=A0A4R6SYW9_9SPHI|nr:amidohydrolase family protein [Pedobacter metabolipauper]TDQ09884.1 L-fuconolactonase [Pedobacter metabolipauper]